MSETIGNIGEFLDEINVDRQNIAKIAGYARDNLRLDLGDTVLTLAATVAFCLTLQPPETRELGLSIALDMIRGMASSKEPTQ